MTTKYHPDEILAIIRANYLQHQQIDDVVVQNEELTFETTISEWRDMEDLLDFIGLGKYLNDYFHLSVDAAVWEAVLEPDDDRTLGDLCNFIAANAEKEILRPVKLFGAECHAAALFRSLKGRLKYRGIDVSDFRPSAELEPLVKKYGHVLYHEVNQLNPEVLPPMQYQANWVYKWGVRLFVVFFIAVILVFCLNSSWVGWLAAGAFLAGFVFMYIGASLAPKQARFENIGTVADLIRKMA